MLTLHRSEGQAQVFLLVLNWLVAAFGNAIRDDWRKIIVSYEVVNFLLLRYKKILSVMPKIHHHFSTWIEW